MFEENVGYCLKITSVGADCKSYSVSKELVPCDSSGEVSYDYIRKLFPGDYDLSRFIRFYHSDGLKVYVVMACYGSEACGEVLHHSRFISSQFGFSLFMVLFIYLIFQMML